MSDIEMTANAGFANPRIKGPRSDGSVLKGESFSTDWLHAKELATGKLAEPTDPNAFDVEPTHPVDPHHSLSVTEHAKINDRRGGGENKRHKDANDRTEAAERALERLRTTRKDLDEAEKAVKDKPSAAARERAADAQAAYEAAEAEAKEFTGN